MAIEISVIVCTHNPRRDFLARALDSLRKQSLNYEQWELLVIDNASQVSITNEHCVDWHPKGQILHERELGLTPARLRGIRESVGKLVVFVDDDNVLQNDYLQFALEIFHSHPKLGAWGGQNLPEFEVTPEEWMRPYFPYLALRELASDRWSNWSWETEPSGAGLCVRREVATKYSKDVNENQLRRKLDRTGTNLVSSGDLDLIRTSYDLSLGAGLFKSLVLTHVIPASRLKQNYLRQLAENIAYSQTMMHYLRTGQAGIQMGSWKRRQFDKVVAMLQRKLSSRGYRQFAEDNLKGQRRAIREIAKLEREKASDCRENAQ